MEVAGFEPAWVFARHTRRINGPVLLTSQPHFQVAPGARPPSGGLPLGHFHPTG